MLKVTLSCLFNASGDVKNSPDKCCFNLFSSIFYSCIIAVSHLKLENLSRYFQIQHYERHLNRNFFQHGAFFADAIPIR